MIALRDRWRRLDVTVRDLPFALLLTAAALVPAWHRHGTRIGDLMPTRDYDLLGVLVIAVECLPLALRRKWPALSLALVCTGFAFDQLFGYHTVGGIALPIALISAGAYVGVHRAATVIVATAAFLVLGVALARLGPTDSLADYALLYALLAAMWAVGAWLRRTRAAEADRRRLIAEATREAERTRIARELHDVVTHHVTAMVVQAEAARYLTAVPDRLDETLTAVTDTGRQAITDLRHLLDLLNPGHGGELRALVAQTRRAGQPVELISEGAVPDDVLVYRVVREALTNALKYDHGGRTVVTVRTLMSEVHVRISSDGSGSGAASPGGSGRGLDGLRERVESLGGTFSAGPVTGGGFTVDARLPAGGAS
ncbi:sensor histidine kinase [Catenuloplanes sp. NPDC051500]|uniref:sensor histidine kinase n=1 Tax=Catenuloplanes sp. NPDC051500 TaxID=3363959 RepID=UPI003793517A